MRNVLLPIVAVFLSTLAGLGAGAQPIQIYSWHEHPALESSGVVSMVWVDERHDPEQAADDAAKALLERPVGDRVVFMWFCFHDAFDPEPAALARDGPDAPIDWYERFFTRLRELEAVPDRIVLDMEFGFSYWSLLQRAGDPGWGQARVVMFRRIWLQARDQLPRHLKTFSPDDFATHANTEFEGRYRRGRDAIIAWNAYADERTRQALRTAIADQAQTVFGRQIPLSNYGDMDHADALDDFNNWPHAPGDKTVAGLSSPALYISGRGQRYADCRKHVLWNCFIDNINIARSCARSKPTFAPWISPPSWNELGHGSPDAQRWLWREMLLHVRATAGTELILLYWNPAEFWTGRDAALAAEERLAASVFAELSARPGDHRPDLPLIPLDAEEVRTGELVTTYTEFMRRLDAPAATTRKTSHP